MESGLYFKTHDGSFSRICGIQGFDGEGVLILQSREPMPDALKKMIKEDIEEQTGVKVCILPGWVTAVGMIHKERPAEEGVTG